MTTYSTLNPIGSSDPRDLYDNAENLDNFVNGDQAAYNDRLGQARKSWAGMEQDFDDFMASSGYQFLGDYASGIELTGYQQILRDTSGEFWRLSGSTTLPYTTTGAGLPEGGAFVAVGDGVLRQELNANTVGQGSDLVAHTGTSDTVTEALDRRVIRVSSRTEMKAYDVSAGYQFSLEEGGRSGLFVVKAGTPPSDPQEGIYVVLANGNYAERINIDALSPEMFGAVGDGVTLDNAAMAAMFSFTESSQVNKNVVFRSGASYKIQGAFDILAEGINIRASGATIIKSKSSSYFNIQADNAVFSGGTFLQPQTDNKNPSFGAIQVTGAKNVRIAGCRFVSLKSSSIIIKNSTSSAAEDITVESCDFFQNSGSDVSVIGEVNLLTQRVLLTGNRHECPTDPYNPTQNQTRAIWLQRYTRDIIISDVVASGVALPDYSVGWRDVVMIGSSSDIGKPEDVVISGCSLTGAGDDCVGISGAKNVRIIGNTLYDSKVTSGVYVPSNGSYTCDNILVADNIIYGHILAGIYLKDTIHYTVTGNTIYGCKSAVIALDQGTGVVGGVISNNYAHNLSNTGISCAGYNVCKNNVIDGFGDASSALATDKNAIMVNSSGVYSGNSIMNGPIAFIYNSGPTNFVVEGNTGYGITEFVHMFISFSGDRYILANNVIATTGTVIVGQPAASASKIYKDII